MSDGRKTEKKAALCFLEKGIYSTSLPGKETTARIDLAEYNRIHKFLIHYDLIHFLKLILDWKVGKIHRAAKKSKCGIFSCLFPWMRRRKARSHSPVFQIAEEMNHQNKADDLTENILCSSPKTANPPTTDSSIESFKLMKFGSLDVSDFGCFRRNDLGKPVRYSSLPILPGSSTKKVVMGDRSKSLDMTGSYIDYVGSCKLQKFGSYKVSIFGCLRSSKPIADEFQHNFDVDLQSILLSDGSGEGLSVIMECDEDIVSIDLEDSSSGDTTTYLEPPL